MKHSVGRPIIGCVLRFYIDKIKGGKRGEKNG